mgnify:CR=1 FL=1
MISQKDYPKKVEKYCDKELLNNTRREIEEILRNNGYIGTYPNFEKNGELKGLKLVEAYNQYELVGREKNVKHYITCVEECIENDEVSGHLMITFLCGTQMMRKDAVAGDIHMCKFSANDKCFIEKCIYKCDYSIVDGEEEKQDLEEAYNGDWDSLIYDVAVGNEPKESIRGILLDIGEIGEDDDEETIQEIIDAVIDEANDLKRELQDLDEAFLTKEDKKLLLDAGHKEEDLDQIKEILGYQELCDKSGYIEFRENYTVVLRGIALLSFFRALRLAE